MKLCKLLILVFLIACSKDDDPLVQLISEIEAFDVGNESNSSDIRIKFSVSQIASIDEFRIIVLPSELSEVFTKKQALQLSSDSYTTVPITSTNPEYSERLSVKMDVERNSVENNKEYVIKILMIGDGFNQLSIVESNKFILTDQDVYVGDYVGLSTWTLIGYSPNINPANCPRPSDFNNRTHNMSISLRTQQDSYSATWICPDCNPLEQGPISFMTANNIISNFRFQQNIPCYFVAEQCQECSVLNVDPCSALFTGLGIIVDDLNLSIDFAGEDCIGS